MGRLQANNLAPVVWVMMQMMQKYVKDDGVVGIDNFDCWWNHPAAIEFLSVIMSASSIKELKKVYRPHFILKAAH